MVSNFNLLRSEAAARKALVRVHHYDVELDLSEAADLRVPGFRSRTSITFAAKSSNGTFLDFIGLSVELVILNGEQLNVAEVVDGQRIHLPLLAAENEVVIVATAAYSSSGEGLHRFVDPADGKTYTYTQYEPADARRVFANFEQPDLKAPFTFHVTAPSEWEVASNQSVSNSTLMAESNTTRWDFATTLPISTYITTVLAGPYVKAEDHFFMVFGADSAHHGKTLDIPLAVYCRASLAPHLDSDEIFTVTKAGLKYFNELFDYPYPFGKYDQAFVPEYNLGAMENPGLVTFTESYLQASRATDTAYQQRANTIMHEMAHMWFGDLVTMGWWDDLWLKESFADFMGHLAVAEATTWGAKSWIMFASRRKAWAYTQDQLPTTHPIVADIPDLEAAKANFDGITYAKGASVLKQLVAYVGQDAFIAGSRRYFAEHEYANTSLHDLLTPLSAASGRDLGEWADQWLQTSGMSTLTPVIETESNRITAFSIHQDAIDPITGSLALRPHRLAVGFFRNDAGAVVRTHSITLDIAGEVTEVPGVTGLPAPDLVLVNDQDHSYAKVRLDERSLVTALAAVGTVEDSLSRSLIWSALWNATRDAHLPAVSYVNAVVNHAGGESEVTLLQTLVDNALYAVKYFCSPAGRPATHGLLMAGVKKHLAHAAPASDEQLIWARALAVLGRGTGTAAGTGTDTDTDSDTTGPQMRGFLAGENVPAGLSVDGNLRWLFWQSLSSRGSASKAELDAELAAATTSEYRAAYCTALAALPHAESKRRLWQEAVEGTTLSNELLSATIAGITMGSHDMLEPFAEPYFQLIERVWNTRSLEIAGRIVRGLFPAQQDLVPHTAPEHHPVVLRTDTWLSEHPDAANGLRRMIVEQRDQLVRALNVQAAEA